MTPQDEDAPPAANGGDPDPIGVLLTQGAAAGEAGDLAAAKTAFMDARAAAPDRIEPPLGPAMGRPLYTTDPSDAMQSVDLGARRVA